MKTPFLFFLIISTTTASLLAIIQKKAHKTNGNCQVWFGTGNGNDPAMQLELTLCFKKGEVSGIAHWTSEMGGSCKTYFRGHRDTDSSTIILHDERFIENKPKKGWQFCLAEEYRISILKDRLEGKYSSKACQDYGSFSLELKSKGEL